MATFITHPAVPLMVAMLAGRRHVSLRLALAGVFVSVLPDADVVGFRAGIPYENILGHRGFSHSLSFAAICAGLGALGHRSLKASRSVAFVFLAVSMASHGGLDAMTDGGLGVAFLAPFADDRYFFAWRPLEVAPLSARRFLSGRGWDVLQCELRYVWLPFLALGSLGLASRSWAGAHFRGRAGRVTVRRD